MAKVVLLYCEGYESVTVKAAVQRGLDLLGGPDAFVKAGEKILLKPNWLVAAPPAKCATTHPAIFQAVCEILMDHGVQLTYGDSPAYHTPQAAAQKTGFAEVAKEFDIPMADFVESQEVFVPDAIQNKKFAIAKGVLDSDGLISLPKLKTHGFLKLTGTVKNQFGCIPGMRKAEFHVKLPNPKDFAQMLVDLNGYLHPRLYIMDGIMAMEGNGPRNGSPKKMNLLLLSEDPIALDATVCRILNVNPEFSPTIVAGKNAGIGVYEEKEIELLGDPIEIFRTPDFAVNRERIKHSEGKGRTTRFFHNLIIPKPYIDENKCSQCGICVKMCPVTPKAVDWEDSRKKNIPPVYRYTHCIRCFCCQEVCPEGAIGIKNPWLRRLLTKFKVGNI